MKIILATIFTLSLSILAAAQSHPNAGQAKAAADAVRKSSTLSKASISICARTADGRKLIDMDSEKLLMPASNMKLISTGVAIDHFGPDHRFTTSIGHDGEIVDGILKGNLYIIGGADPTLGSRDSIATNINKIFNQWEGIIRDAGISEIEGKIIGDGRYFDGMDNVPSWFISDLGYAYGSPSTGLMFYENKQSLNVSAGEFPGDSVSIIPSYPVVPWMEFRHLCSTGEEGTGDRLEVYPGEFSPIAEVRGTYAVDRKDRVISSSNKFPEYTCAHYFMNHLQSKGIACHGGAGDFKLDREWEAYGDIVELGSSSSPVLRRIIFETNHASNNLYAETLFRHIGKDMTGSACYDSSCVAIYSAIKEMSVNTSGIQIRDGSGLSRQNYISTSFICRFLGAMMDSPYFTEYVESLPSPGGNGSLKSNMADYEEDIKSRIKVKSGSMNGVRCYSGYILPSDGDKNETIIFSIMVNNCIASTWRLRSLLDQLMAELAALN